MEVVGPADGGDDAAHVGVREDHPRAGLPRSSQERAVAGSGDAAMHERIAGVLRAAFPCLSRYYGQIIFSQDA